LFPCISAVIVVVVGGYDCVCAVIVYSSRVSIRVGKYAVVIAVVVAYYVVRRMRVVVVCCCLTLILRALFAFLLLLSFLLYALL